MRCLMRRSSRARGSTCCWRATSLETGTLKLLDIRTLKSLDTRTLKLLDTATLEIVEARCAIIQVTVLITVEDVPSSLGSGGRLQEGRAGGRG